MLNDKAVYVQFISLHVHPCSIYFTYELESLANAMLTDGMYYSFSLSLFFSFSLSLALN